MGIWQLRAPSLPGSTGGCLWAPWGILDPSCQAADMCCILQQGTRQHNRVPAPWTVQAASAGGAPRKDAQVQQPLPPAAAQPGLPATGGMRGLHLALARFRQMQEGKPGGTAPTVRAAGEEARSQADPGR